MITCPKKTVVNEHIIRNYEELGGKNETASMSKSECVEEEDVSDLSQALKKKKNSKKSKKKKQHIT